MPALILQSDFGYADGAVSAMYGVAVSVCPQLRAVTESAVTAAATMIPERGVSRAMRQQAQVLDLASLLLHSVTLGK